MGSRSDRVTGVCPLHNIYIFFWTQWLPPVSCFAGGHREITNKIFANWTSNSANSCAPFWVVLTAQTLPQGKTSFTSGMHAYSNAPNKLASNSMPGEMPGTILEIRKLHCQPSGQPLVETCPGVDDRTTDKTRPSNTWDLEIHMYCRWKALGRWSPTAMQVDVWMTDVWMTHMESFVKFSTPK